MTKEDFIEALMDGIKGATQERARATSDETAMYYAGKVTAFKMVLSWWEQMGDDRK